MATYTDNYSLIKPSYSEIADVATINTNMNTIDDIMHSTQVSLAPAYDSTKTYSIGDVVMYELLMYKCKENGVTGTWNASKWERTTASATGGGGGDGSDVEVTQIQTEGKAVASIAVDGVSTDILVPELKVYGEASGSIAEFDDGSNKPMSKCIVEIKAVQSGSGDPSPTNIRPISGFTEANIVVSPTANAQDGTIYSVSWESQAGTVYGCTLDVVSGVMTVAHGYADLGTLNWSYQTLSGDRNGFSASISDLKEATRGSDLLPAIASCYKACRFNDIWSHGIMSYFYQTGKTIIVINNDYTDATAFKTAMAGQKIVYELATPLTYQLTPIQVNSLLGINKVWNDTNGETEVKYRRDIEMLLQRIADSLGGNQ